MRERRGGKLKGRGRREGMDKGKEEKEEEERFRGSL